ncbi:MAG: hypothetical protein NBV76_01050 [Candidatus Ochrobactrum gambitense]|nr:MAG: hypothetical protein NBV76_01050 [Candidatus Ochrobactrum gambitense]
MSLNRIVIAIGVLSCVLTSIAPTSAFACLILRQTDHAALKQADWVVRAKVRGYQKIEKEHRAAFELDVVETLRGSADLPSRITAFWTNSTYGEPKKWYERNDVIIGLQATNEQTGIIYEIYQQGCAPVSFYSDNPHSIELLKKAGSLDPQPARQPRRARNAL